MIIKFFQSLIFWISGIICVFIIFNYQCLPILGEAFAGNSKALPIINSWYTYTFALGIIMAGVKVSKVEYCVMPILLNIPTLLFAAIFALGFFEKQYFGNLLAILQFLSFGLNPMVPLVIRFYLAPILMQIDAEIKKTP